MSDTENTELRLYCLMRGDFDVPEELTGKVFGKLMAQAGHAFVSALYEAMKTRPEQAEQYMAHAQPKIVLKAKNENALRRAYAECQQHGIPCYLVVDAGRTVFPEPTVTCLGIGPVTKTALPKFVSKMQLFENL